MTATQLALWLYVLYNLAATVIAMPAGWHGNRSNPIRFLAIGAVCFTARYLVFAAGPRQPYVLADGFILAGLGIDCGETAESAAIAALAPVRVPRSGCSPQPRQAPIRAHQEVKEPADRNPTGSDLHLPGSGGGI
jgi:MFS family permease